ncbi:hypothetical protein PROFUN_04009 [Planoprotostelium fungivorum]|uniref:CCDC43 PWI-like domain-containing protein n=1 Tax=Planoprotostelium fungivorum TaxID=1890364 RepID=A0A2P6NW79_9EUKA|nr:hypothetical protein PROFUN_04009 [Planoprotostelium fungivorum]
MRISWRKQRRRECIDLSEEMFIFDRTQTHKHLKLGMSEKAQNGGWVATGEGYSVSSKYLGAKPNGSTPIDMQLPFASLLHKAITEHTNAYKCFAEDYQIENRRREPPQQPNTSYLKRVLKNLLNPGDQGKSMSIEEFRDWLQLTLPTIGLTDVDVYSDYIEGMIQDDTSEKADRVSSIIEFVEAASESDLAPFRNLISEWIDRLMKQKVEEKSRKEQEKKDKEKQEAAARAEASKEQQMERENAQLSRKERKTRDALLSRYGYEDTLDENGDIVLQADSEGPRDTGIEVNMNALKVKQKEQEQRDKAKTAHEKKVQMDKEQKEKEALKKEKEKKRTQKKEKQRL